MSIQHDEKNRKELAELLQLQETTSRILIANSIDSIQCKNLYIAVLEKKVSKLEEQLTHLERNYI